MSAMVLLEAKQAAELKAFQKAAREEVKAARKEGGKKKAAEVDARNVQKEMELSAQHREEAEAVEEGRELPARFAEACAVSTTEAADSAGAAATAVDDEDDGDGGGGAAPPVSSEEEKRRSKQEKARAKRDRKVRRSREKEAEIAAETKILESTSERRAEAEAIASKIAEQGLAIHDVAADGHCLFRAVEHQLRQRQQQQRGSDPLTYADLRLLAARHMRSHAGDFAAFFEADEFEAHCFKVEATAEWGGQPELLALANELDVPIFVHAREGPLLKMGEGKGRDPLHLTYHRHYYALGEHYNSTTPLPP